MFEQAETLLIEPFRMQIEPSLIIRTHWLTRHRTGATITAMCHTWITRGTTCHQQRKEWERHGNPWAGYRPVESSHRRKLDWVRRTWEHPLHKQRRSSIHVFPRPMATLISGKTCGPFFKSIRTIPDISVSSKFFSIIIDFFNWSWESLWIGIRLKINK